MPARRLLPFLLSIGIAIGFWRLTTSDVVLTDLTQILLFAGLGVALVAYRESRGPAKMKGCATFASMLLLPVLALIMAGLSHLAAMPALDPIVNWAGRLRFPAFLAIGAGTAGLFLVGFQKLGRKSRRGVPDYAETLLLGTFFALAGGFVGMVWIALESGLKHVWQ